MKIEHTIPFPHIKDAELYACGGCTRDLILRKKPKDIDFVVCTDMNMSQFTDALKSAGARIYTVKPEYMTILTNINGVNMDFVYPRYDGKYEDGRHPSSTAKVDSPSFMDRLKEDSGRRDFTINSIYMNENGELLDFHDGKEDLLFNNKIRAVGNPDERFNEDALRILRGIRFAVQFKFYIEHETFRSMKDNANLILQDSISTDRIKTEINKALAIDPLETIKVLRTTGIYDLLPKKDEKMRIQLTNRS